MFEKQLVEFTQPGFFRLAQLEADAVPQITAAKLGVAAGLVLCNLRYVRDAVALDAPKAFGDGLGVRQSRPDEPEGEDKRQAGS